MTFKLISVLSESQIQELHRLYQGEWWTHGRTLDQVRQALRGSDLIVAVSEEGSERLIAFARVLSDGVFKALIFDVMVAPDQRGRGWGRVIMETLLAHPVLRAVQHVELYCLPTLVPFYEQWGFTADLEELRLLRRERRAG